MISARSELGSSRMPPPAAASAASSCRNSGLPPLRSYSAVSNFGIGALVGEQLRGELFGRHLTERLQVQRHDGGALGVRRPVDVAARTHRGDQGERMAAE